LLLVGFANPNTVARLYSASLYENASVGLLVYSAESKPLSGYLRHFELAQSPWTSHEYRVD